MLKRWSLSMDFSWLTCWAVLSTKYLSVKTTMMSSMPSTSSAEKSASSKPPAPPREGEPLLFHGQNRPTCRIWREGLSKLCLPKWGLSLLCDGRAKRCSWDWDLRCLTVARLGSKALWEKDGSGGIMHACRSKELLKWTVADGKRVTTKKKNSNKPSSNSSRMWL